MHELERLVTEPNQFRDFEALCCHTLTVRRVTRDLSSLPPVSLEQTQQLDFLDTLDQPYFPFLGSLTHSSHLH